mgnify:FL=1
MLNDFYTILSVEEDAEFVLASVVLNASHPIYKGHFEGKPIVPGVCMVYMIQNLLEQNVRDNVFFEKLSSCKFLRSLNPIVDKELIFQIKKKQDKEGLLKVEAQGWVGNEVFVKLKGTLRIGD